MCVGKHDKNKRGKYFGTEGVENISLLIKRCAWLFELHIRSDANSKE